VRRHPRREDAGADRALREAREADEEPREEMAALRTRAPGQRRARHLEERERDEEGEERVRTRDRREPQEVEVGREDEPREEPEERAPG